MDAQPGASSTPADPAPASAARDLDSLSPTELATWRMSGDLPTDPSPVTTLPADSSAATPVEGQAASMDAPAQAASDTADPIKAKTKARIDELLAGQARERDRADRAERHIREQEARRAAQPPADARPAASSAAPAGLEKPDPAKFDYGTADPGYLEALADYKVDTRLAAERSTWERGQQQLRAQEEFGRVVSAFQQRADVVRAKHPDFDAVALEAPTAIAPGSLADFWCRENEAGAEILYHLQTPTNAAETRRILALPYPQQISALVRLGDRLTAADPAARSTTAPPPPPTLSTRATPGDAVARAWALGDSDDATGAIIAAENARDLARLRR
jgi:hypothetical protein